MLVGTFRVGHGAVALRDTFEAVPNATIEVERTAATAKMRPMPCLWATVDDFQALDDTLAEDPSLDHIIGSWEYAEEKYYHVAWDESVIDRISEFVDHEGSILAASANRNGWELKIRFASRDQLDAFREVMQEKGNGFQLHDLHEPGTPHESPSGLTPLQQDALRSAFEEGYFSVPKNISTRELADQMDMSHQSLSEVLRRGMEKLVEIELVTVSGASR